MFSRGRTGCAVCCVPKLGSALSCSAKSTCMGVGRMGVGRLGLGEGVRALRSCCSWCSTKMCGYWRDSERPKLMLSPSHSVTSSSGPRGSPFTYLQQHTGRLGTDRFKLSCMSPALV